MYLRLWGVVSSWFQRKPVQPYVLLAEKIEKLKRQTDQTTELLLKQEKRLDRAAEIYQKELNSLRERVLESHKACDNLQEALDGANEQLKTAVEMTIPALVVAHDVLFRKCESHAALFSMQTAAAGRKDES